MGRRKKKREYVVRPWSIGKCPTADELRAAWANRRRSAKDFVWLLSVLGELVLFTDHSLDHRGGFGNIAGRKGGLKAFIAENAPELRGKYKSIARYARLAHRLKMAFDIYPPAALSLLHPDLPLPPRNMPFLTNHCRKVYRDHLADLPPTYAAYKDVVSRILAKRRLKHPWGTSAPQDEWADEENRWRQKVIRRKALEAIRVDHSYYARDFSRFVRRHWHGNELYPDKQYPDEDWAVPGDPKTI